MASRYYAGMLLGILALMGCASGGDDPVQPGAQGAPSAREGRQFVAAAYDLTIDPVALTGTITPREDRGAAWQGSIYDVNINPFRKGPTLALQSVTRDANGNFRIDFSHAHPFPKPNLANPVSGINRADLGYTGRLAIVALRDPLQFYGGSYAVDFTVVPDADGYFNEADLIQQGGPLSNTYPYVLLADEQKDNRVGITNSGLLLGNYDPVNGGWQASNIGDGDDWVGYDYVHQGQTVQNHFTIARQSLAGGEYTLPLVLLVQWTDPRNTAAPKPNRLPSDPFDVSNFAYRLPHGALDCSVVLPSQGLTIGQAGGSTVTIGVAVRDWDGGATEAASYQLDSEPDITKVPPGASGAPMVFCEFPGLSPNSVELTLTGGSGLPGFEYTYSGTITNALGTALPGSDVYGLIEVADSEVDAPNRSDYHLGLAPDSLAPEAAFALPPRTIQGIRLRIGSPPVAPVERLVCMRTYPEASPNAGETALKQLEPTVSVIASTSGGPGIGISNSSMDPRLEQVLCMLTPGGAGTGIGGPGLMVDLPGGGNLVPLGGDVPTGIHPSFATLIPTGQYGARPFVLQRTDTVGDDELWIADAATGLYKLQLPTDGEMLPGLGGVSGAAVGDLAGPDWNPQSPRQVAVSLGEGIIPATGLIPLDAFGNIYRIDFDTPGAAPVNLTGFNANGNNGAFYPDWHPTENRIIFARMDFGNIFAPFKLATVPGDGGGVTNISMSLPSPPSPADFAIPMMPVFDRDGNRVAFAVFELDTDTGALVDSDIWVGNYSHPNITGLTNVTNTSNEWELYPEFR